MQLCSVCSSTNIFLGVEFARPLYGISEFPEKDLDLCVETAQGCGLHLPSGRRPEKTWGLWPWGLLECGEGVAHLVGPILLAAWVKSVVAAFKQTDSHCYLFRIEARTTK